MDPIDEAIASLDKVPPIEAKEIRVTMSGGLIDKVDFGNDVPHDFKVTLVDHDVEGIDPDTIKGECCVTHSGKVVFFSEI